MTSSIRSVVAGASRLPRISRAAGRASTVNRAESVPSTGTAELRSEASNAPASTPSRSTLARTESFEGAAPGGAGSSADKGASPVAESVPPTTSACRSATATRSPCSSTRAEGSESRGASEAPVTSTSAATTWPFRRGTARVPERRASAENVPVTLHGRGARRLARSPCASNRPSTGSSGRSPADREARSCRPSPSACSPSTRTRRSRQATVNGCVAAAARSPLRTSAEATCASTVARCGSLHGMRSSTVPATAPSRGRPAGISGWSGSSGVRARSNRPAISRASSVASPVTFSDGTATRARPLPAEAVRSTLADPTLTPCHARPSPRTAPLPLSRSSGPEARSSASTRPTVPAANGDTSKPCTRACRSRTMLPSLATRTSPVPPSPRVVSAASTRAPWFRSRPSTVSSCGPVAVWSATVPASVPETSGGRLPRASPCARRLARLQPMAPSASGCDSAICARQSSPTRGPSVSTRPPPCALTWWVTPASEPAARRSNATWSGPASGPSAFTRPDTRLAGRSSGAADAGSRRVSRPSACAWAVRRESFRLASPTTVPPRACAVKLARAPAVSYVKRASARSTRRSCIRSCSPFALPATAGSSIVPVTAPLAFTRPAASEGRGAKPASSCRSSAALHCRSSAPASSVWMWPEPLRRDRAVPASSDSTSSANDGDTRARNEAGPSGTSGSRAHTPPAAVATRAPLPMLPLASTSSSRRLPPSRSSS